MYSLMSFTNDASSCNGLANVSAGDRFGQTPLHIAAQNRDLQTVKLLLRKGANVDAVATRNRSILHFLLEGNENKNNRDNVMCLLQCLVKKRAPVTIVDSNSNTLLHLAAKLNKPISIIKYLLTLVPQNLHLISNVSGNTYLHILLQSWEDYTGLSEEQEEVLRSIIQLNPSIISITNKELHTPLHIAVQNKLHKIIEILLSY